MELKPSFRLLSVLVFSAFLVFIVLLTSCKKEELPVLSTVSVTNITGTSASSGGNISSDGGTEIISRGVCWSLKINPTIADSKTSDGSGLGVFTSTITGLLPGVTYHVRAYATNHVGTAFGNDFSFKTLGKVADCITQPGTNATSNSVTVNGTVNANALSTEIIFEYGLTTSYGQTIAASQSPLTGDVINNVSADLSGLISGTTYHFRIKTVNSLGTSFGNDLTFITQTLPEIEAYPGVEGDIVEFVYDGGKIICEKINGEYYYQGDIILTEEQISGGKSGSKGAGIPFNIVKWPNKTVNFIINNNLPDQFRVRDAIKHWEDNTDIVFKELSAPTGSYIEFVRSSNDSGGSSNLGWLPNRSGVWLGDKLPVYGVIHEIGHAVGLIHEHCRPDRDQRVQVIWDNIISDERHNFELTPVKYMTPLLDYNSIMIYGWDTFSKTPMVEPTLLKLDGSYIFMSTAGLSQGDIDAVNLVYSNLLVETTVPTNVTRTTATIGGILIGIGETGVSETGIYWDTSPYVQNKGTKLKIGAGESSFSTILTGLMPGMTYWLRSYATNSLGTVYGGLVFFTTDIVIAQPSVSTTEIISFTQNSAIGGGNITNQGGAAVTERGVCWSISEYPSIANSRTSDGIGTGTFTSNLTGLNANTKYYVRAYATNSGGTAYGNQVFFTTDQTITKPIVSTSTITSFTRTSAVVGGIINSDGGAVASEYGVYWGTSPFLTTEGTKLVIGSGGSSFSTNLTGLVPGIIYHVVAYAENSVGTGYGVPVKFITVPDPSFNSRIAYGSISDSEGNTYRTVNIGNQVWMAENLNVGRLISCSANPTDNNIIEKQTFYSDNDYANLYGGMYQWNEMMNYKTGEKSQGICPTGWHIPDKNDWDILFNKINSDGNSEIQGKVLKSIFGWESGNGSDLYGFAVLPSGYKSVDSAVMYEKSARFWSSTPYWNVYIEWWQDNLSWYNLNDLNPQAMKLGAPVRCIKN